MLVQLGEHRVGQRLAGTVPASRAELVCRRGDGEAATTVAASRTLSASATTSGPIPSPPITATFRAALAACALGSGMPKD